MKLRRIWWPVGFQLVIDCKDPELLARFWAAALGYVLEPPPEGFATWDDWRRDILTDPQTSGGLLIAASAAEADTVLALCRGAGFSASAVVGRLARQAAPRISVRLNSG